MANRTKHKGTLIDVNTGEEVIFCPQPNHSAYFLYKINCQRGMGHQKVDEIIAVGIPADKVDSYLKEHFNVEIIWNDAKEK